MHFFNPAHIMKLVEVIPGLDTSPETVSTVLDLTKRLGKFGVRVEECASFLVNRLLGRYMNESIWALFYSSVDIETLDKEVCSFNMPIGPLALRDMNGADIGLSVADYNYREYGPRFLPPPLLAEMVKKSILGRKSSAGFYLYDGQSAKPIKANPAIDNMIATMTAGAAASSLPNGKVEFEVERLFLPMINEAFLVLQEKIVSPADLDPALKAGLGMRKGPLELAGEIGLADCLKMLERDFELFGERFRPAPLLKRYVWAKRKTII
jgi:3-hydroxyacyl-CoA dehydrogenase